MAQGAGRISAVLLFLSATAAPGQKAKPAMGSAPIVQPGAPGHSSKTLSPTTAAARPRTPAPADISFMQGMIMHHSQAVEMTELLRARSHNKDLQSLGERISISQTDEIQYMKQWLEDRHQPVAIDHSHMVHSGDVEDMAAMMLVP